VIPAIDAGVADHDWSLEEIARFLEKTVTRFKELRRIEHAIEHKNEAELRWALDYCTIRRKLAATVHTMRKQEKYWRQMEGKVRSSLEDSN
jgi:hypothetical protein